MLQNVNVRVLPCLLLTWILAGCSGPFGYRPAKDINVILISYDTLRADRLGLYGYTERDTSPHLEALSERGIVFENAISQASSTFPSHMSIFQSRYASQISNRSPMLAEILQDYGFKTAALTNGGNVSAKLGFDRGFDSYYETRSQAGLSDLMPRFDRWLRQNREDRFFVFLHTYDIHHPYNPPTEYQEMFSAGYGGPITGKSTGQLLNKVRKIHKFADFEGEVPLSAADKDHVRALYDADIRYADSYLATLDALLRELELWDDTLVIFLSDHGEEFWEHGEVLHSFTVYQEVVHVPLVIWLPGTDKAGLRVPQQVRLIDVAPTVLDVLGIPEQEAMLGRSLLPVIEGLDGSRPAVAEMNQLKAWIEPPHKLIVDHENRELSYFHLGEDPDEQRPQSEGRLPRQLYRQLIERLGPSVARPVSGPAQMDLPEDEELLDQLRALGYID